MLDTELAAMAAESYQRAYGAMVQVQMLSELEEVSVPFLLFFSLSQLDSGDGL